MNWRKSITIITLLIGTVGWSQDSVTDSLSSSQPTEATTSQKLILFGMTAAGVLFLGLGLRNSKFFRKK
ncbi:hypothetical protein [Marinoscillum sp.]|uniref:hypothetical protein n=1 Tax=Marinoscillum sp. TaxID=2024838 RepID=UPI003BAB2FAF